MEKIKRLFLFKQVFVFIIQLASSCFLLTNTVSAQRNNFQTYSLEEGLPQNTVYCITQDKRGYLWLGTDGGGICRFDGINFKTFDKSNGFKGDNVRSILHDSKGRIWAGTRKEGIILYDGLTLKNIGAKSGLKGSSVISLLEDKDGTIWAGTDDAGLNRITQIGKDSFNIKVIDETKGLSNNAVFDIHQDKNGRLWLATYGGINIVYITKDSVQINQLKGGRDIPSDQILSIAEDLEGGLWFGTLEDGVFRIAPSKYGKFEAKEFRLEMMSRKITAYNKFNGFNANGIWKIFLSSENELWFASLENGIIRQRMSNTSNDASTKYIFEHYTDKEGLPGNQILSFYEDTKGNIWIGTNGFGLCKFLGNKFSHYSVKDGLGSNMVYDIDQDSLGSMWVATGGGGLSEMQMVKGNPVFKNYTIKEGLGGNSIASIAVGKSIHNQYVWSAITESGISKFDGKKFTNFNSNDGLIDNSAYCIYVDDKGIVWTGTKDGISRYDGKKFLNKTMEDMKFTDKDVNVIIEDMEGDIWFGTGGGLAKYGGDGVITTYDEAEGLMHKEIKSLIEGPDGNIWIGTSNGGLYVYVRKEKGKVKIHKFANDSLLSSNSIRSIIFQDNENLIVGTDKGFDKITFNKKRKITSVRNYDASDGFVGVECNDNAIYKDNRGNIWFGTVKGLTKYTPSAERVNRKAPQTHITNIKLMNKDVVWNTKTDSITPWFGLPIHLKLPYNENHITFQFAAISLDNPTKVRFRYQLEGLEDEWSPITKRTERDYPVLPPGTYKFKVSAAGANGIWSEPEVISFIINPPWYRTYWFYAICFITVLFSIYSFIKFREQSLIKEKRVLEEKVIERTTEVTHQKEEIEKQKSLIEEKNKDITDSINYAERIQQAFLPDVQRMKNALPDSFVLFHPRDIVSGDFYWFNELERKQSKMFLIAAADCTGHGVPGAFMSMINTSLLNETVNAKKIIKPNLILDEVRRSIITLLKQTGEQGGQKDGMDVALVRLKLTADKITLDYAGANNSLYLIRNDNREVLEEVDPDPMPVSVSDRTYDYTNNVIELNKGDTFYIFTDGYADQFGGPNGKKFKYPPLKKLLISIQDKPMDVQRQILNTTIQNWMDGFEQVDDILIIGVRV